jgi:nitrogen regulatory protein P-II 1
MVVAVIQPTKFNAVREALEQMEVARMTICDGQGFSRHTDRREDYRGHAYRAKLLRKVILEVIVNEDFLERTVETIASVARTGPEGGVGDGKIFVLPVAEAIQISDGHRGPGAV